MPGDDAVRDRLGVLRNEVAYLRRERASLLNLEAYASDERLKRAVERSLHLALEACIDIGRRLLSQSGHRYPESNQEVFQVLAEARVIPPDQLPSLLQMARFRNLIVHDYARIDDAFVYAIIQEHLSDFDDFARAIVIWLDEGPRSPNLP